MSTNLTMTSRRRSKILQNFVEPYINELGLKNGTNTSNFVGRISLKERYLLLNLYLWMLLGN